MCTIAINSYDVKLLNQAVEETILQVSALYQVKVVPFRHSTLQSLNSWVSTF